MKSSIYEEVNMVIDTLPNSLRDSLPPKLNDFLNQYPSRIHLNKFDEIKYIDLSNESTIILSDLYVNYWCKDNNKKLSLLEIFAKNQEQKKATKKKKIEITNEINRNFLELANSTSTYDDPDTSEIMKNLLKKLLS